jgi:hypothetical protein
MAGHVPPAATVAVTLSISSRVRNTEATGSTA